MEWEGFMTSTAAQLQGAKEIWLHSKGVSMFSVFTVIGLTSEALMYVYSIHECIWRFIALMFSITAVKDLKRSPLKCQKLSYASAMRGSSAQMIVMTPLIFKVVHHLQPCALCLRKGALVWSFLFYHHNTEELPRWQSHRFRTALVSAGK